MMGDENTDWKPTPKKKKVEDCVIHCSNNPGKLITVKSDKKWTEILEAAKILGDEKVIEIESKQSESSGVPNLWNLC